MRTVPVLWLVLAVGASGACGGDKVSRAIGAACAEPSDCDKLCLPPSDDTPGGFCTRQCTRDSECPSDAGCVSDHDGVCLFLCRDDRDCDFLGVVGGRTWVCQSRDGLEGGTLRVCTGG